ncbi:Amino acid transporter, transmembrane domain [Phytophthora cactorum]|nr:Amino acid transporter, transmembrane domain [Phytophthora cactorum]
MSQLMELSSPLLRTTSAAQSPSQKLPAVTATSSLPLPAPARTPGHTEEGSAFSSFLGLATTMTGACAVGQVPALLLFAMSAWLAFHACEMLSVCCDAACEFSYEALSSRLFGAAGVWAVRLLTLTLLFGAIVSYMVIAMDLFEPFLVDIMSRRTISLVFMLMGIPLCLPETIHELRFANMLVLLCLLYILVALGIRTAQNDPEFAAKIPRNPADEFNSELAALAYALPIVTLSFVCQLNVPRAYQEIHDKTQMTHVHKALVGWGLFIYLLFAYLGYACFHGQPPSDILTGFEANDTLINGARLALGISMVLKTHDFPTAASTRGDLLSGSRRESLPFRTAITVVFLLVAHLFSISSRNLGTVMAFVGSVAGNVLALTVPGLFLYEVSRGYLVERDAFYSPRLALIFAYAGAVFAAASLTYLSYNALVG